MWRLSGLLQDMLPSLGDGRAALGYPKDLPVSQGDAEVTQGHGWSQAGGHPRCHRQEAEVWHRRGISILWALPSDSAQTRGLSPPFPRAAEAVLAV